jgi:hypothetical protein
MFVDPVTNIHDKETLTFDEIYSRSKKNDDYLIDSVTYAALLVYELEDYMCYFKTKELKEKVFRLIWIGIKVAFLLDPTEAETLLILWDLEEMLPVRDQEFREAFRKSVDNELLNYKNPDPDQARIIKTVIGLMKLV